MSKITQFDKEYLFKRTNYLLDKAIEEERERLKRFMLEHPEVDIDIYATEIGVLVALKNQAKDLIEKL